MMISQEVLESLLEDAHFSLFLANTKERSGDALQLHSDSQQRQFLLGRITGMLQCYSEDEDEQNAVNERIKQIAFDGLPLRIQKEVRQKAEQLGLESPLFL